MEDAEEEEKPDYITASLSLTVSLDQCAEVWMTEEEIKMCFDYANKDFDRFLRLIRFIASFGNRP